MSTVAIVPKRGAAEASVFAGQVVDWLLARGHVAVSEAGGPPVPGSQAVDPSTLRQRTDLVVALGGDGTLLHAARLFQGASPPVLGVHLGSLGFLTDTPRDGVYEAIESVLQGRARTEQRTRLGVTIERQGRPIVASEVLNDVVLAKNALARIADIEARVGGAYLTTYKADGVIVATPTGSSAYALSAGGPLVAPSVEAVLVVPICPHTLTQRPLVLPQSQEIELVLRSAGEMFATLDGQHGCALEPGDRVRILRTGTPLRLVRTQSTGPFAVLRDKLRWGER